MALIWTVIGSGAGVGKLGLVLGLAQVLSLGLALPLGLTLGQQRYGRRCRSHWHGVWPPTVAGVDVVIHSFCAEYFGKPKHSFQGLCSLRAPVGSLISDLDSWLLCFPRCCSLSLFIKSL